MPTLSNLNFLKKKRTKEGAPETSAPSSPVVPSAPSSRPVSAAASAGTAPAVGGHSSNINIVDGPTTTTTTTTTNTTNSSSSDGGANSTTTTTTDDTANKNHDISSSAQQSPSIIEPSAHMNSAQYLHDHQKSPAINNLIHHDNNNNNNDPSDLQQQHSTIPANNGNTPHQQQQQQQSYAQYPVPLDHRVTHSASPGTVLEKIYPPPPQQPQQQPPTSAPQYSQQQHLPTPTNTTINSNNNMALTQQPQPQQQQQQQQQPQVHHQSLLAQQQAAVSGGQDQESQSRVTKGKYSLGDFNILQTLGTGSFGRVHLVQSKHNQRFYAVKVLKKLQVVKMKQVEHTNDERRMLGEVKHPFLIMLWGTFQDPKNLYMVMDFVEGGELFSLLRKSGRFPNPVAKFYAAEVTLALEYLHSKNIIYRDLKPENLLLDRHGHLKITDFGFAKRVPDKTWTLCGTPDYLAPEVVSNKGYNKSVDWWSLGILIYEMLCGYTPFWDSGSPMKIYENILRGKVKYPSYINQDAQDLLERLITADLTKRLGNLYGGPGDVKNHQWFAEVTWDRLARKDIDAPYSPPVRAGAGDASQFDRYPEDPERYGQPGNDEYGKLFTDF